MKGTVIAILLCLLNGMACAQQVEIAYKISIEGLRIETQQFVEPAGDGFVIIGNLARRK